jgi:choline dehydrogenase
MTRRELVTLLTALAAGASRRASAAPSQNAADASASADADATSKQTSAAPAQSGAASANEPFEPEYIVVGSGAGGGTVAARLAEEGYRVLVLEAGGDPRTMTGANPLSGGANALPDDYDVPGFHPLSTENDALRMDFFVRHYENQTQQARDPKYCAEYKGQAVNGVWYPRAGTLGGCTAHNAMIFIAPHESDWNDIADLTGDASWRGEAMRKYFEKLEDCHHRPLHRFLHLIGLNPSKHGWSGWLSTEKAVPRAAFLDRNLRETLLDSARAALKTIGRAFRDRDQRLSDLDPNDWRVVKGSVSGIRYTPLTTNNHARVGSRERLLEVQKHHADKLKIELHALATRVLFDDQNKTKAIGVEYLKGEKLYGAASAKGVGELKTARCSREVILAGGAFNTPQLLMLSGIGASDELQKHGITTRVDLPGVGKNLQDRYEVAVVNRMNFKAWDVLEGSTFTKTDPQYHDWKTKREGAYITNGALLSVILPSAPGRPAPDLFCYSIIVDFRGYEPGYSKRLPKPNYLSWIILKGHTVNTGGFVKLASPDPRVPPAINFRYFEEGTDTTGDDLNAVVAGVNFVRTMTKPLLDNKTIAEEELPGKDCDTDAKLATYIRDNAWGHHASCTCPIGDRAHGGVLASNFTVHGTTGLRVVDASVFPRVPGLFIVCAIYMIGEKAADAIIADARKARA